jgi:hypothetical protein
MLGARGPGPALSPIARRAQADADSGGARQAGEQRIEYTRLGALLDTPVEKLPPNCHPLVPALMCGSRCAAARQAGAGPAGGQGRARPAQAGAPGALVPGRSSPAAAPPGPQPPPPPHACTSLPAACAAAESELGRPLAAADAPAAATVLERLAAGAAAAGGGAPPAWAGDAAAELAAWVGAGGAEFAPTAAVIGGVVGNDVVRAVSHSDAPTHNVFLYTLSGRSLVHVLPPAGAAAGAGAPAPAAAAAPQQQQEEVVVL